MLKPKKKFHKCPSMSATVVVVLMWLLFIPTTIILTVRAESKPTNESENTEPIFSNPTALGPTVNSSAYEWDPEISADGLSLYFCSRRPGSIGGVNDEGWGDADIWVTKRKTKDEPWDTPVNLGSTVNSPAFEGAPSLSADGLSLYFTSGRPGGSGSWDIWVTTRKTKNSPWVTPVNLGSTVNSSLTENGPEISTDDLTLYFSTDSQTEVRPGFGSLDIWMARRETKDRPWGAPVNLGSVVNSSAIEGGPSISADGLSLYFNSDRPGGFGQRDIWVTRRKTKDSPWDTPVNLGSTVNGPGMQNNPDISRDGSTLYFINEDVDIWQALARKTH